MSTDLVSDQAPQRNSATLNQTLVNTDTANDDSKVEVMVLSKSDKTLTKNIDAKDDSLRKRTSLIIVPQKDSPDVEDYTSNNITHNMSSSTIDNENCNELVSDNEKTMEKSSTKSLESSICSNHSSATDEEDLNELHKKSLNANKCDIKRQSLADSVDSCVSRSNSSATNCSSSTSASISTSSSSKSSSSGDDVILDEDYQDLENGNIIEDLEAERKNCISNASSCIDDYSLRQKYEEYVNAKAQDANGGDTSTDADEGNIEGDDDELAESDAVQNQRQATTKSSSLSLSSSVLHEHNEGGLLGSNFDEVDTQPRSLPPCDALLSPQEAPMGRRYAEVAQFKGNKR